MSKAFEDTIGLPFSALMRPRQMLFGAMIVGFVPALEMFRYLTL